jgi:hypothetical protein
MMQSARQDDMTVNLEKITTEFSHEQDRIRITGETEQGGRSVIWLSRRLLGFLLPVLLSHLDRQFATVAPEHRDVLQEFAQQAARSSLGTTAPVAAAPAYETMLAVAVDVAGTAVGVLLTFRSGPQGGYRLPLTAESLRQWLHILYQLDQKAAWLLPQWPAWLSGAGALTPDLAHPMH